MGILLLRLVGPMQSWGTTSRFDERDSQLEPSKSGVLGLICAALGRDRDLPVDDLAALKMGVRVDREGTLMRDYQTATGVMSAKGKTKPNHTVVSPRYYLSDSSFLVGLEGEDRVLLKQIHDALARPVWPIFLGRKGFPPATPVWVADGLLEGSLLDALTSYPLIASVHLGNEDRTLRLMLEQSSEGAMRFDQPIAPFSKRLFGPRYISMDIVQVSSLRNSNLSHVGG